MAWSHIQTLSSRVVGVMRQPPSRCCEPVDVPPKLARIVVPTTGPEHCKLKPKPKNAKMQKPPRRKSEKQRVARRRLHWPLATLPFEGSICGMPKPGRGADPEGGPQNRNQEGRPLQGFEMPHKQAPMLLMKHRGRTEATKASASQRPQKSNDQVEPAPRTTSPESVHKFANLRAYFPPQLGRRGSPRRRRLHRQRIDPLNHHQTEKTNPKQTYKCKTTPPKEEYQYPGVHSPQESKYNSSPPRQLDVNQQYRE